MEELNIKIGGVSPSSLDNIKKRFSCLLWGAYGSGKSTLASTAPGKKCWLLFDPNGADSLKDTPEEKNCAIFDLSSQNCSIVLQGCSENPFGIEQYLKNDTFDTIVFDSVTTYLDLCLKCAVLNTKNASIEVPTQAGYSRRNSYLKQTINNLIRLTNKYNKHIIIIGHEDNGQMNDVGSIIKQSIMMGGSSTTSVCINISEVWYFNYFGGKRTLFFEPFGVKTPMKSRMIDTKLQKSFVWDYSLKDGGQGIKDWFEKWQKATGKITL